MPHPLNHLNPVVPTVVIIPELCPITRPKTQTKLQLQSHIQLGENELKLKKVDLTVDGLEIGAEQVTFSEPSVGGVANKDSLLEAEIVDEESAGEIVVTWCQAG